MEKYNKEYSTLKNRLNLLANISSIHSIKNIVTTDRKFMKIIWVISYIVSFTFCLIILSTNLLDYFSFKVETVVKLHYNNNADFPTVTICELQICGLTDYDYETYINHYLDSEYKGNSRLFLLNFKRKFVLKILRL